MKDLQEYLVRGGRQLGIGIESGHIDKFTLFASELIKWNRKINLTAITNEIEIAIKHFLDSLVVTRYVDLRGELLDLGSGGGFPAIPLKIILPEMEIYSVDAVEKKIFFQRHVARLLSLDKFTALHARGESLVTDYSERFPQIISRAFSDITKFAEIALPLLAPEGNIIAMKGRSGRLESEKAGGKLALLGLTVSAVHEFQIPCSTESRSLVIITREKR
jgi:16S rRNA (guanine527-N7)-methyltransferase